MWKFSSNEKNFSRWNYNSRNMITVFVIHTKGSLEYLPFFFQVFFTATHFRSLLGRSPQEERRDSEVQSTRCGVKSRGSPLPHDPGGKHAQKPAAGLPGMQVSFLLGPPIIDSYNQTHYHWYRVRNSSSLEYRELEELKYYNCTLKSFAKQ